MCDCDRSQTHTSPKAVHACPYGFPTTLNKRCSCSYLTARAHRRLPPAGPCSILRLPGQPRAQQQLAIRVALVQVHQMLHHSLQAQGGAAAVAWLMPWTRPAGLRALAEQGSQRARREHHPAWHRMACQLAWCTSPHACCLLAAQQVQSAHNILQCRLNALLALRFLQLPAVHSARHLSGKLAEGRPLLRQAQPSRRMATVAHRIKLLHCLLLSACNSVRAAGLAVGTCPAGCSVHPKPRPGGPPASCEPQWWPAPAGSLLARTA